jgi:hypothetical protein
MGNPEPDDGQSVADEMRKSRHWHHDIKYIDGAFVEDVVLRYQQTNEETLIQKILKNYEIFRPKWGRTFAPYLDDDVNDGESMHDSIVWKSASKFKLGKARKANGRAFNAYLVSALLNQLKNLRNARMSHKNHPRVQCPVCRESVYQIDQSHLAHRFDLERYRRTYSNYPLSSDGQVPCPITGMLQDAITIAYVNRIGGRYSVEDFWDEFPEIRLGRRGLRCPVSGTTVKEFDDEYFRGLGYSEQEFVDQFPEFRGIILCPFTKEEKFVVVRQEYFDKLFGQQGDPRITQEKFDAEYPNFTVKAKQIPVFDPYGKRTVPEITPKMLAQVETTVTKHLEKYATIILDKTYPDLITCPFTGRKTHVVKTSDLERLGKTVLEFYHATCKYPLRKFQVHCAICGKWIDNVWSHLEEEEHTYAQPMTTEQFENSFGCGTSKAVVSTNAYVENDAGDVVHIGDLFGESVDEVDFLELEDSLLKVAQDDLDRRIAKAISGAHTVEDIFFLAAEKKEVKLPFAFRSGMTQEVRQAIKGHLGDVDFDIAFLPQEGQRMVLVMVPGRQTVRDRMRRMIEESDLCRDDSDPEDAV